MKWDIEVAPRRARSLPFVIAWAALMLGAGISLGSAFLALGRWAPIVEFAIAAVQAAVVFALFMRLKGPPSLKWVAAGTRFFWLSFLFGLSMLDYTTRRGWPWHG
jgi:cytochrome c oxidase subunit IV